MTAGDHLEGASRGIEIDNDRARLHLGADDALIDIGLLDHDGRTGERMIGCIVIAETGIDNEIAFNLRIDTRRAVSSCLLHVHHGRQFSIFDGHALSRVLCRSKRFGDNQHYWFAKIARPIRRHWQVRNIDGKIAGKRAERALGMIPGIGRIGEVADRPAARRDIIRAGQDRYNARLARRIGHIDRQNLGVRIRRTHEYRMTFGGKLKIVGIMPVDL